jgi:hypothetical protein
MLSLHHGPAREAYLRDVAESVALVRNGATEARASSANYS